MDCVKLPNRKNMKIGVNSPCPCGSGKKFKRCCRASNGDFVDRRVKAHTTLAQAFRTHPSGTSVFQAQPISSEKYGRISIYAPSSVKLCLHIVETEQCKVIEYLQKGIDADLNSGKNGVVQKRMSSMFDFFESAMKVTIFGYTAIEAFANESIPNSYIYKKTPRGIIAKLFRKDDGLPKKEIERAISTSDKLKKILPVVLSVDSIAGKELWDRFINLRDLRDSIIHIKTHESYTGAPGVSEDELERNLYQRFINGEASNIEATIKEIIRHYKGERLLR